MSAAAFLLPIQLWAELFISPTTAQNRFVVPAGHAALISSIMPKFENNEFGYPLNRNGYYATARIVINGVTNAVAIGECKNGQTAIAGPAELLITNICVIQYKIIVTTNIFSPRVKHGTTTTITVPAGKTLQFFSFAIDGISDNLIYNATVATPTATVTGLLINGKTELDGPVTVTIQVPAQPDTDYPGWLVPYYFTDKAVFIPDALAIQAPTGNGQIELEKSTDLNTWAPSVTLPISNDAKSFYRLRVQ